MMLKKKKKKNTLLLSVWTTLPVFLVKTRQPVCKS